MAGIEFYTNPMSRSQIIRWMLEEVGEPYEEHILTYGPEMKSDAYLAINPMGKVPSIRHDGKVVTECAAICAYLAEAFPKKGLAPKPEERADYYRWLFFAAGPVEQAITANSMGWVPEGPQKEGTVGFGSYERTVNAFETAFDGKDYAAGNRFTAADVYVGSQIIWGMQFGTLPQKPGFEAYANRLTERPAYLKAKARDAELIASMKAAEAN